MSSLEDQVTRIESTDLLPLSLKPSCCQTDPSTDISATTGTEPCC